MNPIATLSTVMGLSFTSGINLYATVFIVGLSIKNQWVVNYPQGLDVLSSWPIIIIAGIFYMCEFIADKIPAFDSFWDIIHTLIRPLSGAAIAFGVAGKMTTEMQIILTLLGGGIAFTSHSTKTGARLAINTSPEPLSNSVASVTEDAAAIFISYLAMTHPYIALGIVSVLLFCIFYWGPGLIRFGLFNIKALIAKIILFKKIKSNEIVEGKILDFYKLNEEPLFSCKCFFKKIKKIGNYRSGYLLKFNDENIIFIFKKLFRRRKLEIKINDIVSCRIIEKFLCNILEIKMVDKSYLYLLFTKNRNILCEQIKNIITTFDRTKIGKPIISKETPIEDKIMIYPKCSHEFKENDSAKLIQQNEKESQEKSDYYIATCNNCNKKYKVGKIGKYKCKECDSVIEVK